MSACGALRSRNGEVIERRLRRLFAPKLRALFRPSALQHFGQTMDDDVQEAADEKTDERRDRNGDVRVERAQTGPLTLGADGATLCPLSPEGKQVAPRDSDASSRRGAPRCGDRRPMRVVTRGRLLPQRFSTHIQGGRGPSALMAARS